MRVAAIRTTVATVTLIVEANLVATTAAAISAPTTGREWGTRSGFFARDFTAIKPVAVHLLDCVVGVIFIGKRHKSKATRTTSVAVLRHEYISNFAIS